MKMTPRPNLKLQRQAWLLGCAAYALAFLCEVALSASEYYESRKLTSDEITKAKGLALYIRTRRPYDKTNNPIQRTPQQQAWYNKVPATSERFEGIGSLFIVKVNQAAKPTKTQEHWLFDIDQPTACTAFYVAPTVLATAAHCLWDAGVTPDSKHELIFRQHYDGSAAYTDPEAAKHERVITEWVYPKKYQRKPKGGDPWCRATGYDYAFMRTHAAKQGSDVYRIVAPDQFIKAKDHTQLLLVGYPHEYAAFREMVSVNCKLHGLKNDPDVEADPGIKDDLDNDMQLEMIDDKQIFCLGDQGNMQPGGSGGPWMLADSALPADAGKKKEQSRWVLGITSWSYPREPVAAGLVGAAYEKQFVANQKKCLASASGKLRQKDVDRYESVVKSQPTDSILTILDEALKKENVHC